MAFLSLVQTENASKRPDRSVVPWLLVLFSAKTLFVLKRYWLRNGIDPWRPVLFSVSHPLCPRCL